MIILFIIHNLFLHGDVLAGPLSPLHSTLEISSHPREINPNKFTQRSEWNIVWSCLATLFACSWVAIHPNIPAPSDSSMRIFFRRLMIMGYMLIAPEFVIIWAARQWCAAREIVKDHKDKKWTKTHAFFALMGGFMLYKDGVMTETLEIEELAALASRGKSDWPSISEKEIQDRSKGDAFSKAFAILQTTWFITQCIARGVSGLIITELELATLAFAALNGILYFLWWHKPLDVACPVPIHLHPFKREAGMQTIDSECEENPDHDITIPDSSYITLALNAGDQEPSHEDDPLSTTRNKESTPLLKSFSSTSFQHHSAFARFRAYFSRKFEDIDLLAPIYIFIIKPCRTFWEPIKDMNSCDSLTIIDGSPTLSVPTFYAPNTPNHQPVGFIGGGVGILFGGIHCIAWSFGFQSAEEKYVWRISAVTITVIPLTLVVFGALVLLSSLDTPDSVDWIIQSIKSLFTLDSVGWITHSVKSLATLDSIDWIIRSVKSSFGYLHFYFNEYKESVLIWTLWVAAMAYCISRAALIIIPLLALRSLPPEALLDIKWSAFIPHI